MSDYYSVGWIYYTLVIILPPLFFIWALSAFGCFLIMNNAVMCISVPRVFLLQAVQWMEWDSAAGAFEEKLAKHWGGSSRSLSLRKEQPQQWLSTVIPLGRTLQKQCTVHAHHYTCNAGTFTSWSSTPSAPTQETYWDVSAWERHYCRRDLG